MFDVTAAPYSATGDGVADDTAEIQAAIDAAELVGGTVLIPDGKVFKTSLPLRIDTANTRITGGGKLLAGGSTNFPCFVVAGDQSTVASGFTTGAAINAQGTGHSLDFVDNTRWVVLSHARVHGKAQFDLALYHKPTAVGSFMLVSSRGAKNRTASLAGDIDSAFSISDTGGPVQATLNVGGTVYTLTGGTLVANTMKHIELSYDGTTIRLYVGGLLVDSELASGTIVQKRWEDVVVGPNFTFHHQAVLLGSGPRGLIQHVRIGETAVNTGSSFSVPVAMGPTTGSLVTVLLTTDGGDMLFHYDAGGDSFGAVHLSVYPETIDRVQIDHLWLSGYAQGIFTFGALDLKLSDLYMTGIGVDGIYLRNNSYNATLTDIHIVSGAGIGSGVAVTEASGVTYLDHFKIVGFTWGVCILNSGASFNGAYLTANSQTCWGLYVAGIGGSAANFEGSFIAITDEAGSQFQAPMHLDSLRAVSLNGLVFETTATVPHVTVDEGDTTVGFPVTFTGCDFRGEDPGAGGHIVSLGTWPTEQIRVVGCRKSIGDQVSTRAWGALEEVVQTSVPGLSGTTVAANNLRGSVTVKGPATTAVANFDVAETDALYFLSVTPTQQAGLCAIQKVTKTTTGFTLTVSPAPVGTATFDWILIR